MSEALDQVLQYHQATKHVPGRFARGPGHLDWATQPDPFRRYQGARLVELEQVPPTDRPLYDRAFAAGHLPAAPLDRQSISQLLFDSLALSAWKQAGGTSWALRVNPSSGNLHPTEGYLVCGPVVGLAETAVVAHYAPREHALEIRAERAPELWQALAAELPPGTVLVGLTSVHWREAWKYGERAFRYCQHDVGHALAALRLAAAGLGWQARLLDGLGTAQIARLLGLVDPQGAEPEHPDCLLAVCTQGQPCPAVTLPAGPLSTWAGQAWQGQPNRLSPRHVEWSIIDEVAAATEKPPAGEVYPPQAAALPPGTGLPERPGIALRRIIHQRRSAVAMDGRGSLGREAFYRILDRTLARPGQVPFDLLPWPPHVHLALFVHRVEGLEPGLYLLVRDPGQAAALRGAVKGDFAWERPAACPGGLDLVRLVAGDARAAARQLSCQQAIAADGCFSLGMIARFEAPLATFGPWFYRRLYWECGLIGQVLYLEAEAAGLRGTGIGCFFDDPVRDLLGLEGLQYQSLYHFTVGHPVEDRRLTTLPPYPPSPRRGAAHVPTPSL